ncbi:efflux RND transporter periplasmic adaptor subunit [Shewanella surugensis]|uniref:Efflux RND transporter periplasmic adaptor subunit n=2 Tax=Shewanella surugensis TaxID=212020 RepID=A0ABT0L984_9GAMM|nr:efflux RND transporter periplasmic adaptor subunit [Shewanella surugensis]MCL1124277.1 efflux RND transporter periplasmic adaptor subunit [Shewanella surugensis]
MLSACHKQEKAFQPKRVVVANVVESTVPIYGYYVGVTEASLNVEVRARIDGFVEQRAFVEGSAVKKGDLLYQIDSKPYVVEVNRVKAQRTAQQAVVDKAKRDVERLQPLYDQDAASQLDLDNALSNLAQAKSALVASQAALEAAELELSYTRITAPISGLVSQTQVDVGALVGSKGQSLLTKVQKVNPIYVMFNMSALDYLNARRRMVNRSEEKEAESEGKVLAGFVRVTLPDYSEYTYPGKVSFTEPSVNPETGTFEVRAVLPNPDKELLPGQYTNVRIKLSELRDAIVIPQKATQVDQGGVYVMVVLASNRVERRFIVIEHQGKEGMIVKSGLKAGEKVIVEGMHRVRHGQLARPLSEAEYLKLEDADEKDTARKVQVQEQSSANKDG